MWVFGYGSLMWDRWEEAHGYVRREKAMLDGYRRVFNKPSIKTWGTKTFPCPTLNLVRSDSSCCHGMAFEFLDHHKQEILAYLAAREGKDFALLPLTVRLNLSDKVIATVPVYDGWNVISSNETKYLAEMALRASGRDGPCIRYVRGISEELRRLGIDDPTVRDFWDAVAGNELKKLTQ
jgi:cation transport protein ChaC